MTDRYNNRNIAGREVGERRLVSVRATSVALPEAFADELDELTVRFVESMGEGLMAASVTIGLDVLGQMMAAEVAALAGPKGRHDPARTHVRHGSEAGSVTLGDRKVPIRRPRVRTAGEPEHGTSARAFHQIGIMLAELRAAAREELNALNG